MYVTRALSQLLKSPESVVEAPDGPNSGFLVLRDEESLRYSCFGIFNDDSLKHLPFPQDKELIIEYDNDDSTDEHPLFLIPALNRPLSFHHYYAIVPHRKLIGEAYTSSREEDKVACCFFRCVKDVKSRPLDPRKAYQQIRISPYGGGGFRAESVGRGGFPPYFLRRKGWKVCAGSTPGSSFKLAGPAPGLDPDLRSSLLGSLEPRAVGKWYTPFVFVREDLLRDQVKGSMYYEVVLEQRWEKIFETGRNEADSVVVDVVVEMEAVFLGGRNGRRAAWNDDKSGVIWFKGVGEGGGEGVGLRVEVVETGKDEMGAKERWMDWRGREGSEG